MRTLFYNGTIYQPSSRKQAPYRSMLIENGLFKQFFTEREPKIECDESFNLNSNFVYPPFFDSHTHFVWGGSAMTPLNFLDIESKDEIFQRIIQVRKQLELNAERGWLIGLGLDSNKIQINREELDDVCGQFPCIIDTRDLHSAFANRLAFERANAWQPVPNPEGGIIERNVQGEPNGWLREFAVQLIKKSIPPSTSREHFQWYKSAEKYAHSFGIIGVGENATTQLASDYLRWDADNELKLRIDLWLNEGKPNQQTMNFQKHRSERLRIATQKMFLDGSLGSATAYMKEPYENSICTGMSLLSYDETYEILKSSIEKEWEIAVHCIGDAASEQLMDVVEELQQEGFDSSKVIMEHCQVLPQNCTHRISRLGITASMQPVHLANDRKWMRQKIGIERCKRSFMFRQLSEASVNLRFGSDWPVEDLNPILGLKMSIENNTESHPEMEWYQSNLLPFDIALQAFTYNPHKRTGWHNSGRLSLLQTAIGTTADFIIIECDLATLPTTQWSVNPVLLTWMEGECLYVK